MTFESALSNETCHNPTADKEHCTDDQNPDGAGDAAINRTVMHMHFFRLIQAFVIMNHDTSA